jgi:biopolymer transport protein ExbD
MKTIKHYFSKRRHEMPGLNTASLPDLIFTVLFFFMIVTHMRTVDPKVAYRVPQGSEVKKLGHKGSIINIYIGRPTKPVTDPAIPSYDGFYIQLNNQLVAIDDVKEIIADERNRMSSDDQARMTVSIKADRDVPMGLVSDVKRMLQQSYALKINYSANERIISNE